MPVCLHNHAPPRRVEHNSVPPRSRHSLGDLPSAANCTKPAVARGASLPPSLARSPSLAIVSCLPDQCGPPDRENPSRGCNTLPRASLPRPSAPANQPRVTPPAGRCAACCPCYTCCCCCCWGDGRNPWPPPSYRGPVLAPSRACDCQRPTPVKPPQTCPRCSHESRQQYGPRNPAYRPLTPHV